MTTTAVITHNAAVAAMADREVSRIILTRPAVEAAIEASRNASCLVEEWVDGPEVTVNAFSVDGRFEPLTVTDRLTAEPPAFGVALAPLTCPAAPTFTRPSRGVVAPG